MTRINQHTKLLLSTETMSPIELSCDYTREWCKIAMFSSKGSDHALLGGSARLLGVRESAGCIADDDDGSGTQWDNFQVIGGGEGGRWIFVYSGARCR